MSKSISNGLSVDIPVQATHSLKLAWLGGTYTAKIISGAANLPVALATNSASDQTFGPYATAIMVRLTVSAIGRVAWDTASAPAFIPPGEQFTRQDDGIPVTLSGVGPAAAFAGDGAGNSAPSERVAVTASRALTAADHGKILEIQNAGLTLTTAFNTLPSTFFCVYSLQSGTTSFAFTGGATCNGAATTITRAASANKFVGFASRATANAFDMDGV